jgi:hypothetical protein
MRARLAALGLAAALYPASPAAAATVTLRVDPDNENFAGIVYRAAPGETNRLSITFTEEFTTIRVADPGAPIAPSGAQCHSVDPHIADCTIDGLAGVSQVLSADAELADGNDVVESRGPGLSANGGPGDDSLSVESIVAATLNGGAGHDTLLGGSNGDTLIDGDATGAADADLLDGRGSEDMVSYATRGAPVRVDLADAAPDGEIGEGDVLRSVERVRGGRADDVIAGTAGRNLLEGNGGADRVLGRAGMDTVDGGTGDDELGGGDGPDFISGGPGSDVMRGNGGNDIFLLHRSGADVVTCGAGRGDQLAGPDRRDLIPPDCERATFEFSRDRSIGLDPHPGRSLIFRLECPKAEEFDGETVPISGSIALRSTAGRLLGRGAVPAEPGRRCGSRPGTVRVPITLNARGRRLLARRGGVRVTVAPRGHNLPRNRWTIRLEAG